MPNRKEPVPLQPASLKEGADVKARRGRIVSVVLLVGVAALLRVVLADLHGLWADEFFSLAMATGHSLEQLGRRRVPEDVVRLLHGRGRVALVVIHSGAPAPQKGWLEKHATPAGGFRLLNARVLYFTAPEVTAGTGDATAARELR
jgi:hypothetical protein